MTTQTFEVAAEDYALDLIATSGQAFRWQRASDIPAAAGGSYPKDRKQPAEKGRSGWIVPAMGGIARIDQRGDTVRIACAPDEIDTWKHYLRLDERDQAVHAEAIEALSRMEAPMPEIVGRFRGMRVLRQDPWETAVSFVISQNNTIARIRGIIERLCGGAFEPFPESPQDLLARLATSDFCMGYRAPYLEDLCSRWDGLADSFSRRFGYQTDYQNLLSVQGIGPKVANCICLYGLDHLEAVPVDTWIRKAQKEYRIPWHARYGGLQQQMVFEWMRSQNARKRA